MSYIKKEIISGIYCFENLIDGKKYIGQARNLDQRTKRHYNNLRKNKDDSPVLQNAWNKYREENFYFYIIELCELDVIDEREIYWIEVFHSHVSEHGYNISWGGDATMRGLKHSEETKKKLSEANKGRVMSQEFREKDAKAQTGRKHSEETKKKMSESAKGKPKSEESKKKMSEAKKGKYLGEENHNYGKPMPEEQKKKISISKTGVKIKTKRKNSTSKYYGVSLDKRDKKWYAFIEYNGKTKYLGSFINEIEAAKAYNAKSIELYGENAKLNKIED